MSSIWNSLTRAARWQAALTLTFILFLGSTAIAEIVDQGQPGDQGPWPVTSAATSTSTSISSLSASSAAPAKTTTALVADADACTFAGDTDCTNILASTEIINWPNVAIAIHNAGANTVDNVVISFSSDGTTWETWDTTTFATLLTTDGLDMRSMQIAGSSRRYLRIDARAAANTSVDVWLTVSRL